MWSIRFAAVSYDLLSVCEGVKNNVEKNESKSTTSIKQRVDNDDNEMKESNIYQKIVHQG